MMKKNWEMPVTVVQKFEPNEYVAACWGVKCDVVWSNQYEMNLGSYSHGIDHKSDHCGNSSNQVIYDYNDDKVADAMKEVGTDGLGDLDCVIYTNEDYTVRREISNVKVGDTIFWTTSALDGRTWHHKGTVFATAEGHPNRS